MMKPHHKEKFGKLHGNQYDTNPAAIAPCIRLFDCFIDRHVYWVECTGSLPIRSFDSLFPSSFAVFLISQ